MLTVMCPNCRHRFPAPGCCNPGAPGHKVPATSHENLDSNETDRHELSGGDCAKNGSGVFYGGGYLLVPREYDATNRGCFINAPTIIHGPTIIQQPIAKESDIRGPGEPSWTGKSTLANGNPGISGFPEPRNEGFADCRINTTCDLTGGTVTITTPRIQSGGCLIQSTNSGLLVQAPRIEIRPKLFGGGCLLQKRFSVDPERVDRICDASFLQKRFSIDPEIIDELIEDPEEDEPICPEITSRALNSHGGVKFDEIRLSPPSGCQELPGIRNFPSFQRSNTCNEAALAAASSRNHRHQHFPNSFAFGQEKNSSGPVDQQQPEGNKRHSTCCCGGSLEDYSSSSVASPGIVNQLNSNRLASSFVNRGDNTAEGAKKVPSIDSTIVNNSNNINSNNSNNNQISNNNSMEIRVNATVQLPPNIGHCTVNITATAANNETGRLPAGRTRNNFNGGGIVQFEGNTAGNETPERREDAPTTPVSWLMPCPWGFDNYPIDKDVTKLAEIKRLLHTSGWYHEGLSWQQSETLLKNAPLGRWLMRDSSDSRFIFAVSVQTSRGPTSVRVHYFLGRFRLDAEPRLSLAMPLFECPIKMLEHYVDYSKRIDEHRKEVWVDYSGQLYSQIYLTKPLVKEVQTLSHLARVVVNSNKLSTDHLPPLIKNYLAEYPYSL